MTRSGWPATLTVIAEIAGDTAALKMMAAFGGVRVYVPMQPTERSPLTCAIGIDAARALAKKFGGEELQIPNGTSLRSKKQAILRAAGNNTQIARATGSTRQWVREVRKAGAATEELPLFRPHHKV